MSTPQVIDVKSAQEVTPKSAPVIRSLSGKEQAGVYLTWGVLVLMALFLIAILLILRSNEVRADELASALIQASQDAATLQTMDTQRAATRTFWLEVTKTILLNVLLPVLTALLGYVFGTTQAQQKTE
jgi:Zn-dependent protease with chaperone function